MSDQRQILIDRAQQLLNQGYTYVQTANTLNEEGFTSPTGLPFTHQRLSSLIYKKRNYDHKSPYKEIGLDARKKGTVR